MKIVSLIAENIKRIKAVHIDPKGNLVEITGRNGQGKTSVLDSIWWALDGAENVQAQPIRKGENAARVILKMEGEGRTLIVTRKFKARDQGFTTELVVENGEGARFSKAQSSLNELIGALSFDPLQFARMKPREQFDALRRFVPGVDFDALDGQNKTDFERRTDVNRAARDARAAANMIVLPAGLPEEPVDEDALTKQLQSAGEHNADIKRREDLRTRAAEDIRTHEERAKDIETNLAHERERIASRGTEEIRLIMEQIEALNAKLITTCERVAREDRELQEMRGRESAAAKQAATDLRTKLAEAPPLPARMDADAIAAKLGTARATNAQLERARQRAQHINTAEKYEAEAAQLTANIDARNKAKLDAVAAAQMPVPGLSFGDGIVLMDGVPFEQASDAQRLRASVAIAMAANPKLRVIRVRDGSLLDDDAMRILGEMCNAQDFQCWIETVAGDGKDAFVIEDGQVSEVQK